MNYPKLYIQSLFLLCCCFLSSFLTAQTSWKGTTSTAWALSTNWTNNAPTALTDVVIGDSSFTGVFQPVISAAATCKSLTVGTGGKIVRLTVSSSLSVNQDITIAASDTIIHTTNNITVKGIWANNGVYDATTIAATVVFAGAAQSISGATRFKRLTINTGSTTVLNNSISVETALLISGIFDPNSTTYLVTLTGATFTVNTGAILKVKGALFSNNYSIIPTLLNAASTVDYASSLINQTIAQLNYGTLSVSGGLVKTPADNITLQSSSSSVGKVSITAGVCDLTTFTLNRGTTVAGGSFTVANGATLKIGGNQTFPANYTTRSLATASTVEYNGADQSISAQLYGNLILNSSSGAVVKTMPGTAMTIANDFTSIASLGASVSYTALAALTVKGNLTIGAATTFNGGTASHTFVGNFTNNGTFTGSTSTVTMSGTAKIIGGSNISNFYNFTITGLGTTSPIDISIAGNLTTSGPGTFVHASGSTVTMTGSTKTIVGTGSSFSNLTISGSVSTTGSFIIAGNLVVNGSLNATAGIINMSGTAQTLSGSGTVVFYAFRVAGTVSTAISFSMHSDLSGIGQLTASGGTLTFIGTSTFAGTHNLFNVTLNGSKLQLGANAYMGVAGVFTRTLGTFDVTTTTPNTVDFNAAANQTITSATYNNLSLSISGTKTAGGAITVNNALSINTGTAFNASTFTHTINGNWLTAGTFTAGTSTIQLRGTPNATITGATAFNILTIYKTAATNFVTLNNNISAQTLNMTLGDLHTGSNSITVTTTRTGNSFVLGTIIRTHAFSTAVAYAFEGPNNTITFASIASGSVTSISVTTAIAAAVDFPLNASINRLYTIGVTNTGTYSATLKLHYQDAELAGNVESTMGLWHNPSVWTGMGKSSNDVTNNWVQQAALTDITNRWTISDNPATAIWKGTTSTAWATASNWKTGTLPLANDVIQIGAETFTNQPAVTTAITVKSIILGSIQPVTLTLSSSGSLTVKGNISSNWLADAIHTINIGSRTLAIGGDLILSNGNTARAITLNISTGILSLTGALTQATGANIIFTGAGSLNIGGDFNYTGGTFTASTGTVNYNGPGSQIVAGGIGYRHLTFNKASGVAIISSPTTIAGNLSLSTGGELNLSAPVTVAGNVTINGGSILSENGIALMVGGNWSGNGLFNASSGTVIFNSAIDQTVALTTFNNLTVSKANSTLTPGANITINGDLNVSSGVLDLTSYTADRSIVGGRLTLGAGATLKIGGAHNFPANYNIKTFSPTGIVEYNGMMAQDIAPLQYGHLVLNNGWANPKTLTGNTAILGDLSINSGVTLDADSNTLSIYSDFINAGTFLPGTGTVVLQGGDSLNHKALDGPTTFYNFIVNGCYATTPGTDLTFLDDYEITGYFNSGLNEMIQYGDQTITGTFSGDGLTIIMGTQKQFIRSSGIFVSPLMTSTIAFRGTEAPTIEAVGDFVGINMEMSNTSDAGIVGDVDLTVLGYFLISPGCKWSDGGKHAVFLGSFINNGAVVSTGTLTFAAGLPLTTTPSTTLYLGSGSDFQSSGTVEFAGVNQLIIDGTPSAFTNLTISNTNAAGITPAAGWIVNGDFTVNHQAIFHAGAELSHTFDNDIRIAGTFDGGTSTIIATSSDSAYISGSGVITFYNLTIAGEVDAITDFNIARNFTNNGIFEAVGMTVSFTGDSSSVISGSVSPVPFENILINKGSNGVTLNAPATISQVGTFTKGIVNTTSANYMNFLPGSSTLGGNATSYVDGPVRKTGNSAFAFPVGNNNIYRAISMSAPAVLTDHFTAQYFKAAQGYGGHVTYDPSLATLSNCEYWTLNRTNGSSAVNVELGWNSSDCPGSYVANLSTLRVARWDGSSWANHGNGGTTGNATAGTVTTSAPVTNFSPFALASTSSDNALPIELLTFTARPDEGTVYVNWETALEINNAFFTVEKSNDGITFSEVGKVEGAGNSTSLLRYELLDATPFHGISYYRLRQTDFNSNYSVSSLVAVNLNGKTTRFLSSFTMSPNPAHNQLLLHFASLSEEINIAIHDMAGKEIYNRQINPDSNDGDKTLSISGLNVFSPGIYIVTVFSHETQFNQKLILE